MIRQTERAVPGHPVDFCALGRASKSSRDLRTLITNSVNQWLAVLPRKKGRDLVHAL